VKFIPLLSLKLRHAVVSTAVASKKIKHEMFVVQKRLLAFPPNQQTQPGALGFAANVASNGL
jgi:hypothetical protein